MGDINKEIVIVGNSGFAYEVKWLLERMRQWEFKGFVANQPEDAEDIFGDDEYIENIEEEINVVIAIADPNIRANIYEKYKSNPNIRFPNIIDPSVILSQDICMGEGNIICANNVLTVGIKMGSFNIINLASTIGHETSVGDFVTVNPGVNISGKVDIGSKTFIGTGAKVIQERIIGENTLIGAGAVVIRNIPANCRALGVPAQITKREG